MSRNSPQLLKKKPPAKKQWKAVPSKRSATSPTKPKSKVPAPLDATLARFKEHYPDAHCELNFESPFELLIATILSAQCTDARVNMVTPGLFEKFPDPPAMAKASLGQIEEKISSINFFRNKAKSLKGAATALVEKHDSQVPKDLELLMELPGVGRKTANCVLGNAFNIGIGVVVDTHVGRLSNRLGWTKEEDPIAIEQDLMKLIPKEDWVLIAHLLIFHGRRVCKARGPACDECFLFDLCPRRGVK